MKQLVFLLCLFLACSCSSNKQEKHQSKRNNIVNVHNQVKEIDTGDVLISESHRACPIDEYLAIIDYKGYDKMIHIFDSKTYKYLASTGDPGQGPGEFVSMGDILWNKESRQMYVADYGSMNTYAFLMDSVLNNPSYKPEVKAKIANINGASPSHFTHINDTLSFAVEYATEGKSSWQEYPCRYNLQTGEMKRIVYPYPKLKRYRVFIEGSLEKDRIIVSNKRFDILSVLDFDGRLICNVYGPDWDENNRDLQGFGDAVFYQDKILALYDGRKYSEYKQFPKIMVFTQEGDYEKTLDVGYEIDDMTLDETNHRLILSCNDEIQFGYLDLDEVL